MKILSSPLLLASGSPRRQDILHSLRIPFVVAVGHTDETREPGETPDAYIERVVEAKLRWARAEAQRLNHDVVLVADTIVVCDGDILGKPLEGADNVRLLTRLSGRSHEVWTRFAVARCPGPAIATTVRTTVTFRNLAPEDIDDYVATGEGRDKAGGYAIQGLGAFAVTSVQGSYSNVVGLPACELVLALRALPPSAPLPSP